MTNWWTTREAVKRAAGVNGAEKDAQVDRIIEAMSREMERRTRRFFIPRTETRLYRWPQRRPGQSDILWLDQDLISVTTLQTKAQDASPTTIASTDYFVEPNNTGPPYDRIEIDQSSTAAFEAGDTPQRSMSVAGSWGYSADTRSGGTVSSGLASDATATSMLCGNASLIDVGETLLIESEQVFVSDRSFAARASILIDGALTADMSEVTVTVDGSHGIVAGETIRVDSEQMYVSAVSTNDLTVIRAYNGSTLAAHSDDTAVHINRTFTIERGVNGTTAATHANATAISVYEPPLDVQQHTLAEAVAAYHQESSGWGREVGMGEAAREFKGSDLATRRERLVARYRRVREAAI